MYLLYNVIKVRVHLSRTARFGEIALENFVETFYIHCIRCSHSLWYEKIHWSYKCISWFSFDHGMFFSWWVIRNTSNLFRRNTYIYWLWFIYMNKTPDSGRIWNNSCSFSGQVHVCYLIWGMQMEGWLLADEKTANRLPGGAVLQTCGNVSCFLLWMLSRTSKR